MKFQLQGGAAHVHPCSVHVGGCDFFDHLPTWLVGNRDAARDQLVIYRWSVVARIAALTAVLALIDAASKGRTR